MCLSIYLSANTHQLLFMFFQLLSSHCIPDAIIGCQGAILVYYSLFNTGVYTLRLLDSFPATTSSKCPGQPLDLKWHYLQACQPLYLLVQAHRCVFACSKKYLTPAADCNILTTAAKISASVLQTKSRFHLHQSNCRLLLVSTGYHTNAASLAPSACRKGL